MKNRRPKYHPSSGSASGQSNGPLFAPADLSPKGGHASRVTDHGSYANGDIFCQFRKERIDRTICVIQSQRQPDTCEGCPHRRTE